MIDIIKRSDTIEIDKTDVFIAGKDIIWYEITIYKDSLVVIYDGYIYINETPLGFFSLLDNQYGDKLLEFKKGDSYIFKHKKACRFNHLGLGDKITIKNGSLSRWNVDHFCYSGPPSGKDLDELPKFKYKGRTHSTLGYKINIKIKEIEGGFYKRDNKFFEMVGDGVEDLKIK